MGQVDFFPFSLMRQATKSPKHTNLTEGPKDGDGRLCMIEQQVGYFSSLL